jgi:hypothetical protein
LPPSRPISSARRRELHDAVEDLRVVLECIEPAERDEMLDYLGRVPGLMRTPTLGEPCEVIAADFDKPPAMIRREIATACMAGLLACTETQGTKDEFAAEAVDYADRLITALRTIPDPNAEAPR